MHIQQENGPMKKVFECVFGICFYAAIGVGLYWYWDRLPAAYRFCEAKAGSVARSLTGPPNASTPAGVAAVTTKPKADREAIAARLAKADAEAADACTARIAALGKFIDERKAGAGAFDDAIRSWEATFLDVTNTLDDLAGSLGSLFSGKSSPSRRDSRFAGYVHGKFNALVLGYDQFNRAVEGAVDGFDADLRGLEDRLIVDLKADLDDASLPGTEGLAGLRTAGRKAWMPVPAAIAATAGTAQMDFVASGFQFVASDLLGNAVSKRVMPGDPGWKTRAGVNVGSDLLAGQVLATAMKQSGYDPRATITAKVHSTLDGLRSLLIVGDPASVARFTTFCEAEQRHPDPAVRSACSEAADALEQSGTIGLESRLKRWNAARSRLRRAAVYRHLLGDAPAEGFTGYGGGESPQELIELARRYTASGRAR